MIRREMQLGEGEMFNGSNLEKSRRKIAALGYFETVTVSTSRGSSDEFVDVNVEVRERPTGQFQVGAGFSSIESFIVQGQVAYENFLGRAQSVAVQAQISSLRRIFSFRFVEPSFLGTKWGFATELYNQSRGFGAFSRNSTGGALTWGRQLSDHASASLTYRLENVGITSGSGGVANLGARSTPLPTFNTANLLRGGLNSSVRGTLGWDSRDNRLLPTDGRLERVSVWRVRRKIHRQRERLRAVGRLHTQLPSDRQQSVRAPAQRRARRHDVLLGGIYDIRGYQPRSIGPQLFAQRPGDVGQILDPLPLGGNVQVIGNAEVEFPIAKRLGLTGVAFFDIRNAYNLESRFCNGSTATVDACVSTPGMLGNLRKSVGIGVRWRSPIGPLRLEWGIPLDLKPGEKPSGLDFTIGTSF